MSVINEEYVDITIRKPSEISCIQERMKVIKDGNPDTFKLVTIDLTPYLGTEKIVLAVLQELKSSGAVFSNLKILGIREMDSRCCEVLAELPVQVVTLGSDRIYTACIKTGAYEILGSPEIIFVFEGRWTFELGD